MPGDIITQRPTAVPNLQDPFGINLQDILHGGRLGFPPAPQPPPPPPPPPAQPPVSGGTANPQTPQNTDPLTTLADLYTGLAGGGAQQPQYLINPVAASNDAGPATGGLSGSMVLGLLFVAAVAFVAYRWWKKHHGKKAA